MSLIKSIFKLVIRLFFKTCVSGSLNVCIYQGLLERVRERGASTPRAGERRVHEQLARLFAPTDPATAPSADSMLVDDEHDKPKPPIVSDVSVVPMEVRSDYTKNLT